MSGPLGGFILTHTVYCYLRYLLLFICVIDGCDVMLLCSHLNQCRVVHSSPTIRRSFLNTAKHTLPMRQPLNTMVSRSQSFTVLLCCIRWNFSNCLFLEIIILDCIFGALLLKERLNYCAVVCCGRVTRHIITDGSKISVYWCWHPTAETRQQC